MMNSGGKLRREKDDRHQRFLRLIELIEDVNNCIEMSEETNSPSMVKQYIHLKKKLSLELLELLKEYKIPFQIADAA